MEAHKLIDSQLCVPWVAPWNMCPVIYCQGTGDSYSANCPSETGATGTHKACLCDGNLPEPKRATGTYSWLCTFTGPHTHRVAACKDTHHGCHLSPLKPRRHAIQNADLCALGRIGVDRVAEVLCMVQSLLSRTPTARVITQATFTTIRNPRWPVASGASTSARRGTTTTESIWKRADSTS